MLDVIDYHVAGEPLRIIAPRRVLPGSTMAEKARAAMTLLARDRALATQEPRGHRDIFAAFVTDPVTPGADFGALICDGEPGSGYKGTCGHGSIALAAAALEEGWIAPRPGTNTVTIDVPDGPVVLKAEWDGDRCAAIVYRHVTSHVIDPQAVFGPVRGALVAAGPRVLLVDAAAQDVAPVPREAFRRYRALVDASGAEAPDLVQFRWQTAERAFTSITFFGAAGYDRSPCGTATSALAAFLAETGALEEGRLFTNTTLFGTAFEAGFRREASGLRPEIRARAFRTGTARLCLAPDDPMSGGLTPPDLF